MLDSSNGCTVCVKCARVVDSFALSDIDQGSHLPVVLHDFAHDWTSFASLDVLQYALQIKRSHLHRALVPDSKEFEIACILCSALSKNIVLDSKHICLASGSRVSEALRLFGILVSILRPVSSAAALISAHILAWRGTCSLSADQFRSASQFIPAASKLSRSSKLIAAAILNGVGVNLPLLVSCSGSSSSNITNAANDLKAFLPSSAPLLQS